MWLLVFFSIASSAFPSFAMQTFKRVAKRISSPRSENIESLSKYFEIHLASPETSDPESLEIAKNKFKIMAEADIEEGQHLVVFEFLYKALTQKTLDENEKSEFNNIFNINTSELPYSIKHDEASRKITAGIFKKNIYKNIAIIMHDLCVFRRLYPKSNFTFNFLKYNTKKYPHYFCDLKDTIRVNAESGGYDVNMNVAAVNMTVDILTCLLQKIGFEHELALYSYGNSFAFKIKVSGPLAEKVTPQLFEDH